MVAVTSVMISLPAPPPPLRPPFHYIEYLKRYCPAEKTIRFAYFHVISPTATKYTTWLGKNILQSKAKAVVCR